MFRWCDGHNYLSLVNTPSSHWNRREFLKLSAATTLGLALSPQPVMAGPFTREDFDHLIPADKKLSPDWVKSLFERGAPEVLRGGELKYVGMPVGGIGAGQLYLGGDGRLWHWDIFNQYIHTAEEHYANPPVPASPLAQKFSLTIGGQTRALDRTGFSGITFRGEYPIGLVEYADAAVPVAVKLEAFSPFIPLQTDDSSLPATILQFTLRNTSAAPVEALLSGQLENGVCLNHRAQDGLLRNRVIREPGLTTLLCSAEKSDRIANAGPLENLADFGTMALALLGATADHASADETAPFTDKLSGTLDRKLQLAPGESATVTFVLAWHFPNLSLGGWNAPHDSHNGPLAKAGRYYANQFSSAHAVVQYVAAQFDRLAGDTRLWRDTWYDSTLPFWFLDRTFLNTSTLATSTCYRFANGRFYGWEGVGCCRGNLRPCVSLRARGIARLFPDLERYAREKVDFGLAQQPDGAIHFRGEFNDFPAVDGQAGTILRALREHQMSADAEFLKRNWPKIKLATQWLIAKDGNGDGLIESNQHNTLDSDWFGRGRMVERAVSGGAGGGGGNGR
jgi:non-lysosomal glucosylceramidase